MRNKIKTDSESEEEEEIALDGFTVPIDQTTDARAVPTVEAVPVNGNSEVPTATATTFVQPSAPPDKDFDVESPVAAAVVGAAAAPMEKPGAMSGYGHQQQGRVGRNVHIFGAEIHPTAIVGDNCHLAAGVKIGQNAVVGNNCHFHSGAQIMENVRIGSNSHFHVGTIVKNGAVIGDNCHLQTGSIVWPGGLVKDNSHVAAGSQIGSPSLGTPAGFSKGRGGYAGNLFRAGAGGGDANARIGSNVSIGVGAKVNPTSAIGNNCTIGTGVQVGGNVSIGENTVLKTGAVVGEGARIGSNCNFGMGANLGAGSFVGDNCRFAMGTVVRRGAVVPANTSVGLGGSF